LLDSWNNYHSESSWQAKQVIWDPNFLNLKNDILTETMVVPLGQSWDKASEQIQVSGTSGKSPGQCI